VEGMNKLAAVALAFILIVPIALAEMDIDIYANSGGEELNFHANPNSGTGPTNYYLDGKNFDDEVNNIYGQIQEKHSTGVDEVFYAMGDLFYDTRGYFNEVYTPTYYDLEHGGRDLRQKLDSYFVPRSELMNMIAFQQQQIMQLQYEVRALQLMFNEEDLCKTRIQVMHEYNLSSMNCKVTNTTFYNHGGPLGDQVIGITQIS
jgi:hypothetical protein